MLYNGWNVAENEVIRFKISAHIQLCIIIYLEPFFVLIQYTLVRHTVIMLQKSKQISLNKEKLEILHLSSNGSHKPPTRYVEIGCSHFIQDNLNHRPLSNSTVVLFKYRSPQNDVCRLKCHLQKSS